MVSERVQYAALGVFGFALVIAGLIGSIGTRDTPRPSEPYARARWLMDRHVTIDGHNDIPWQYRLMAQNRVDPSEINLRVHQPRLHTDIPRLIEGKLGAQFWSVYTSCALQGKDGVRGTMEQIDVMKRIIQNYSDVFEFASTADDIEAIFRRGKIASLFGMEGGHSIDSSLAALRMFYDLGARYMTLTHNCHEPWVDSCCFPNASQPTQPNNGISQFGRAVIREMNRIGMFVDLSHVSEKVMLDVLQMPGVAPVIFSHSSARGVCNVPRNVPDNVLRMIPANGGVVMTVFASVFVNCDRSTNATIDQVIDHMDHMRNMMNGSADYIGFGADYDGVAELPDGLGDVSTYPRLVGRMLERGNWTDEDVVKVMGGNLLRAMRRMEGVARNSRNAPGQELVTPEDIPNAPCRSGVPL